jgi:hypothetical protein
LQAPASTSTEPIFKYDLPDEDKAFISKRQKTSRCPIGWDEGLCAMDFGFQLANNT